MSTLNFAEIAQNVNAAVLAYEADFAYRNVGCLDFGHCGSAVILMSFGRKRKLKQSFIDAGFINEKNTWGSNGKQQYVYRLNTPTVGTQFMGFYVQRVEAAVAVLQEELGDTGVEIDIHSWVD